MRPAYQFRITTNGYGYGAEALFFRSPLLRWLGFKPVWRKLRWMGNTPGKSFSSWCLFDAPVVFATKEEAEECIAFEESEWRKYDGTYYPCNPGNEG